MYDFGFDLAFMDFALLQFVLMMGSLISAGSLVLERFVKADLCHNSGGFVHELIICFFIEVNIGHQQNHGMIQSINNSVLHQLLQGNCSQNINNKKQKDVHCGVIQTN